MHATTLAVTIVMAVIYLVAVRLIDFNEKEPLWAVLLVFAGGVAGAVVLLLAVDSAFLELNPIPGVMATELARFVGIGLGLATLTAIGKSRGYSEINGLMDGVVYGGSGGRGFATGLAFAQEVLLPVTNVLGDPSIAGYGELALTGMSDGVFGALIGIGIAAALDAKHQLQRSLAPVAGLAAATAAHVGFDLIGKADQFGDAAQLRKWIALLLPVAGVAVVAVVALGRERRAITEELKAEAETGAVTTDELDVLQSFFRREAMYFGRLFRGDFRGWGALHGLHNRQVQLALAKRRVASDPDESSRTASAGEVARLRLVVFELKRSLGMEAPEVVSDTSQEQS